MSEHTNEPTGVKHFYRVTAHDGDGDEFTHGFYVEAHTEEERNARAILLAEEAVRRWAAGEAYIGAIERWRDELPCQHDEKVITLYYTLENDFWEWAEDQIEVTYRTYVAVAADGGLRLEATKP